MTWTINLWDVFAVIGIIVTAGFVTSAVWAIKLSAAARRQKEENEP